MKTTYSAIVLDMNGVIVQSNNIKHAAMVNLFAKWPHHQLSIEKYNRHSGGIKRRVKFRHIWEQILELKYDADVESYLAKQYELALMDSLLEAPIVEGVDRLISIANIPIYVCSAAPLEELHRQLDYRHFSPFVTAAFGDPVEKSDALRQVVAQSGAHAANILFFGDSLTDRDAAVEVGVDFVAVIREKNEFVAVECLKIFDFLDWTASLLKGNGN